MKLYDIIRAEIQELHIDKSIWRRNEVIQLTTPIFDPSPSLYIANIQFSIIIT